jgi:hypothetical protein
MCVVVLIYHKNITTGLGYGKGYNALGKVFAECRTRHTSLSKILASKEDFAEGFISGTWQRLC